MNCIVLYMYEGKVLMDTIVLYCSTNYGCMMLLQLSLGIVLQQNYNWSNFTFSNDNFPFYALLNDRHRIVIFVTMDNNFVK